MALNVTAAYAVHDTSQIAGPRRAALDLARRSGFSEERAGQVALVVTELATNLTKHATDGEMLFRLLRNTDGGTNLRGIEILAVDRGPGIQDPTTAREDGYSTAGSLGHGLGSIDRQSDFFQIYSQPSGTVALARLWSEKPPIVARKPPFEIGAVIVSYPGEDICGDDWDWTMRDERVAILVADGLGHGLSAHEASAAAVGVFQRFADESPSRVITEVHTALRPTRGAAVAMVEVDTVRAVANYCGVGNIGAVILTAQGNRYGMISQNGTAGHVATRIHEFSYPVPRPSTIVMFSDGLVSHWSLTAYPGLGSRHASVIAGILYRDFSRRRDDVTIVVAKSR